MCSLAGAFTETSIYAKSTKGKQTAKTRKALDVECPPFNTDLLKQMYTKPLPINDAKLKDLMHLKRFCSPVAKDFFDSLKATPDEETHSDVSDD